MKIRHDPNNIRVCYCVCHPLRYPGLRDDPACGRCGVLVCPTCTQVVPRELVLTVLALEDAREDT